MNDQFIYEPKIPIGDELVSKLVRWLELSADKIWSSVLVGNQCQSVRETYEEMKNPKAGDLVFETSTLHLGKMRSADEKQMIPRGMHGFGYLIKIVREPIMSQEEWQKDNPGEPVPDEKVIYIKLLNGKEMRWTNAEVLKIPINPH